MNFRTQVFSAATLCKQSIEDETLCTTNLRRAVVSLSFILVCTVAISLETLAGPRAYVSAQTGSDNNPCTVKSPCRQIRHALTVVDTGGEVIVVDSGHYLTFQVRRSVSVMGAPGAVVTIGRSDDSSNVNFIDSVHIKKPEGSSARLVVVLRSLTLHGGERHGINFFSGDVLHVEGCVINDFPANGIEVKRGGARFPGDPPTGEGDAEVFVKDTIIRNCDENAVPLSGDEDDSVRSVIEHCRIENNLDKINAIDNAKLTARE